jgi:hypothetical protein
MSLLSKKEGKMKKIIMLMVTVVLLIPILLGTNNSWAAETVLNHVIPIPGFIDFSTTPPTVAFDISWVDSNKYYLTDPGTSSTTGSGRIDIFDAIDDIYLGSITGFYGNHNPPGSHDFSGPNGVLVLHNHGKNELWTGDGDSTVKVVDLDKMAIVATIPTGTLPADGKADELAYDSKHHIILISNPLATTPFVTFISQETRKVLGKIDLPEVIIGGVNNGIEQPVFDPKTNLFYLSLPATVNNPGGEIAVIDPVAMKIIKHFPVTDCNPNGLALGPNSHLLLGCGSAKTIIMDENGGIVATITEVGGSDQVWFNPGDNRYYLAAFLNPSGPVLGVIDAKTNTWIENVPTIFPSHSVAVNPTNNHIFVPVVLSGVIGEDNFGIAVYEHEVEKLEKDRDRSPR